MRDGNNYEPDGRGSPSGTRRMPSPNPLVGKRGAIGITRYGCACLAVLLLVLGGCTGVGPTSAGSGAVRRGDFVRVKGDGVEERFGPYLEDVRTSLTSKDRALEGTVLVFGADTLHLRPEDLGAELRIPRSTIDVMQIRRKTDHGALGAGVGAVSGAVLGGVMGNQRSRPRDDLGLKALADFLEGMFIGGALGGAFGFVVGKQVEYDEWTPVRLGSIGVYVD